MNWFPYIGEQAVPTGFILFVAVEYDKNLITTPAILASALQGGGSVTVGIVFIPQKVTRIPIPKPGASSIEAPSTYITWSTSMVVIPTINAGVSAGASTSTTNARYGFGLVFGQVDNAADVVGWTGGGSLTFEVPALVNKLPGPLAADGINMKVLAVKNTSRPVAVTNTLVLIGLENGTLDQASTTKFFNWDVEAHLNLSYVWDFSSFFATIGHTSGVVIQRITGQQPSAPTQ
jgi:hypothetical protein